MRRTKIVATIGPASETKSVLPKLLQAGADIVRANFSHGDYQEFERMFKDVRSTAKKLNRHIPIIQDLQGPKLRVGEIAEGTHYRRGNLVTLTTKKTVGNADIVPVGYKKLPSDVKKGDPILLKDGEIELEVLRTSPTSVTALVRRGGLLCSHQGMNLPGIGLSIPSVTAKDKRDLDWGLKRKVDWIAISFVKSADDVTKVRKSIARKVTGNYRPRLMAKIEKPEAVSNLQEIIDAADGVMVARGDLGVETAAAEVPFIQKEIIHRANRAGKPVVTATHMLESMVDHPRPTRAEVSDIANAVLDGTDAVMLSEETAVGQYPVQAVRTMRQVITDAEHHLVNRRQSGLPL